MKKLLLTAALVAFFGVTAMAQQEGIKRGTAGLAYGTEVEEMGVNIGLEYLITDEISGGISYTSFFTPDPVKFSSLNIDGRYYFSTSGPYVYGLLGLGVVRSKVDLGGLASITTSETGLNLGGGVLFPLTDDLGFLGQVKYNTVGDGQIVLQGGISYDF